MSYLSIALQRQIERHRITQSDLARSSGISKSYISRLFAGESRDLSDWHFLSVLKVFSADLTAQAELLAARCNDAKACAVGIPAAELVDVTVKNSAPVEKPKFDFPEVHLSEETERAFAWLRSQCPLNSELEKHLVGYAKLTGMK